MIFKIEKFCFKTYIIFSVITLTILLITCMGLNSYADIRTKNILIINSYQKGLSWTDDQTEGVLKVLKCSDYKYRITVEYMDWKNYPTTENIKLFFSNVKYKYSNKQIDLIITTDDAALNFALTNRHKLFKDAPIVFSGVNAYALPRIISGYSNVTGIQERVDFDGTINAALHINPNLKEIYVIHDKTESGVSTGDLALEAVNRINPEIKVISLDSGNYNDVLTGLDNISKDSIVLITTYYMSSDGTMDGFQDFTRLVSNRSRVPVYHLYDFGLGYGTIGGSMLSGKTQGEYAGEIAHRIMSGEDISEIPVVTEKTTQLKFDYQQLKRFKIPLKALPDGSQITNKPSTFFETYKNLVITIVLIFLIMAAFICILIFYIKKISKIKQELYNSNTELTSLYEELTASEEELRQQYNELTAVQKSLDASQKGYSLLFEKILNGFAIFEPIYNEENRLIDMTIVSVNPGFEKQIGRNINNILDRTCLEVFKYPSNDLSIYQKVLQTGESEKFESYNMDGSSYLVNAFKINDNQIGVVFDNITRYKNAIRQIRKLNEELEHRVDERTNELLTAVNELEAFTYTVSHDLKSPLRAIDSYSRIVMEDYSKKLGSEGTDMILHIRNICSDMIDMINKLLKYSMTSREAVHIEEINMEGLFLTIFDEFRSSYPERGLVMKIETGLPTIYGDRVLLKQALYNIFSNAVKFTRNKEVAEITVGSTITTDEYIFYITDNGVGFDMKYSNKLFGIFQRLHTSDEFEGSGIGLVTVRKIIEKHGGRTWIEGKVDAGATVYFTLPFNV